MILFRFKYSN